MVQAGLNTRQASASFQFTVMPPLYIWSGLLTHISRELNISNQSRKLYWYIVLQKDQRVRFHLCPRGPSWAPAILGSGGLLSRQKTQWPTLQGSPKQPLRTPSKTKPLANITRRRWTRGTRQVLSLIQISHTEKWQDPRLLSNTPLWYFPRVKFLFEIREMPCLERKHGGDRNIKHSLKAGSSHLNTVNPLLLLLPLFR